MRFQVQRFFFVISALIMRNRLWSRIRTMWEYFDSEIDANEHELALIMTEQKIKYFPHSPYTYCAITYHRNRYAAILVEWSILFCSFNKFMHEKRNDEIVLKINFRHLLLDREKSRKEEQEKDKQNIVCLWDVRVSSDMKMTAMSTLR